LQQTYEGRGKTELKLFLVYGYKLLYPIFGNLRFQSAIICGGKGDLGDGVKKGLGE